jgi:hypothetical protein
MRALARSRSRRGSRFRKQFVDECLGVYVFAARDVRESLVNPALVDTAVTVNDLDRDVRDVHQLSGGRSQDRRRRSRPSRSLPETKPLRGHRSPESDHRAGRISSPNARTRVGATRGATPAPGGGPRPRSGTRTSAEEVD